MLPITDEVIEGRVTVVRVAAHAGVSPQTVSNVLVHPDRVASDTLARVRRAIDDLGFIPNGPARQLRGGSRNSPIIAILSGMNDLLDSATRGMEVEAARWEIPMIYAGVTRAGARMTLDTLVGRQLPVRGVVLGPDREIGEKARMLATSGVRVTALAAPGTSEEAYWMGRRVIRSLSGSTCG